MADTLETLEIEVQHSATDAAEEIKSVASAVRRLGTALEKVLPTLSVFQKTLGKKTFDVNINATVNNAETINQVKTAAEKATKATKETSKGIRSMADESKKSSGALGTLAKSLGRIAFYRIVRSVIKSITSAFTEGLEKAYLFSSGIDGAGNRFAASLDRMKSATNQMKGQLGSAFISLLAAIEPILTALINIVTRVADAISQLLSAFTGTTYLKANATTAKFADNMKKGAGSAKEWKNQLLGFDEINRLNAPSGGGGGSADNPLEGYSFEDTPIAEKWIAIAEKVKEVFETLKASAVGLWQSIKVAFDWGEIFDNTILILTGVVDVISGLFSGDWTKVFNGAAKVVQGFGGIVSQVLSWIQNIWVNFVNWIIEWVNGLFDRILVAVDSFFAWLGGKLGIDLSGWADFVKGIIETIRKNIIDGLKNVRDTVSSVIEEVRKIFHGLIDFIAGVFTGDWARAWSGLVQIFQGIVQGIVNMFYGVVNAVISAINNAANIVGKIIQALGGNGFQINIGYLTPPQVFASGGFPEDGLFFANHNELVGQFDNGRTAVANNDQIIEGIRQGVYDAVSAAMTNNGTNGTPSFNLYLDSKQIKYGLQRLDRAMG